jgi:alpha-N-acetylglucosaminidase
MVLAATVVNPAHAGADPTTCATSTPATNAESALLRRTIGVAAQQVCFQLQPNGHAETFTVSGTPGHITIAATSESAASTGAGWYLKYVVHADAGLGNFTPTVPRTLPAPASPITQTSSARDRYVGNDTQDGYTNPYMSWPEWENMLDMYALHGYNEVYVLPGTDAVYAKVLQDFGYTAGEAQAWVPLPATQPWWAMQNLWNDTTPISPALLAARAALGKKIVTRCKQLGITPVLPGFFGTVPVDFAAKNSTADNGNPPNVVAQGTWSGTQRPSWLDPTDPLFAAMAKDYYQAADSLLGASSMYRMNPLQEGGNLGNIDPGQAASRIMTALQAGEPGATWMQLGWGGNPTQSELNGLTDAQRAHLLIADGTSDTGATMPNRDATWPGTDWLFGTIPFGGGQISMGANGQVWLDRYYTQVAKSGSHMTGIAFQPEGLNDPAAFELFAELPWHATTFGLADWMRQYALGRYGTDQAAGAWAAIAKVYARPVTCCGKASPFGKNPSLNIATGPNFDTQTFATGLPLLADAAGSVVQKSAFDYDLADVANQVIVDWGNDELPKINSAYQAKDAAGFGSRTAKWLHAMGLQDQVLGTVRPFLLGRYVADATDFGSTPAESAELRSNVLHLWTTWYSESGRTANLGSLQNYAAHELSGMISGYYEPNWKAYFDSLSTALANNTTPVAINWLARGNTFASSATQFPAAPHGNTAAIAKQIATVLDIRKVPPPAFTTPVNGSVVPAAGQVAGTGVAGDPVTVTDDGSLVCSAVVAAAGTWSCVPASALASGPHTLSAVQSDAAGDTSSPATVTFTVGAGPRVADHWTFDSATAGVVADTGSDHYDGTITGTTTLVAGKIGQAAKFDGSVAPITTTAANLPTPWAVGAWVNPAATSSSANLLGGPRIPGNSALKVQQAGGAGRVGATSFYVEDYSVNYVAPLNSWTYLTYVDDDSRITVYANGQSVGVIPASFPLTRSAIGSNQSNVGLDVYNGMIDDMTVFANSLTPEQVATLYASASSGGTSTGLVAPQRDASAGASSREPASTGLVTIRSAAGAASGRGASRPLSPLPV